MENSAGIFAFFSSLGAIFIVFYFLFNIIVMVIAKGKGRSGCAWFILSLLFTPILTLIFLFLFGDSDRKRREKVEEEERIREAVRKKWT